MRSAAWVIVPPSPLINGLDGRYRARAHIISLSAPVGRHEGAAARIPWLEGPRACYAIAHARKEPTMKKLTLTDEQWRERLSPEAYSVLRNHGTERAFSGCFVGTHEPGTYVCAGCGNPLFRAGMKFESGTGWPSFTEAIGPDAVTTHEDRAYGMVRTEVLCARCDGHLGHVFPDGPAPTGLRYCMNSVAMRHVPEGEPIKLVEE
jgi:peptide-methionine (R)-S-oxide reductase